jgi:hypothetical protein
MCLIRFKRVVCSSPDYQSLQSSKNAADTSGEYSRLLCHYGTHLNSCLEEQDNLAISVYRLGFRLYRAATKTPSSFGR